VFIESSQTEAMVLCIIFFLFR